jgi:hypothetical protein
MSKPRVLITVAGGVAEFQAFGDVDVDIIDFDNLKEEGLGFEARQAEYEKLEFWLKTGEVPA